MNKGRQNLTVKIARQVEDIRLKLDDLKNELITLQEMEQLYFENMPESLQQSDKGTAAEEFIEHYSQADDHLQTAIDSLSDAIAEMEEIIQG